MLNRARLAPVAHYPFLYGRGHQHAVLGVKLTANKSPCAGCRGTFHAVEQPVVHVERAMEPHRVIDRRHLHATLEEAHTVRLKGDWQEVKVRGVPQQILMHAEIFRHLTVGADPDLAYRICGVAFHRVVEFDGADLQRFIAQELFFHLRRQQVGQRVGNLGFLLQILRLWRRMHGFLVLIAGLWRLE